MASDLLNQRTSGVLLHPTSLPGPHGCGDFGPNAYYFVDWLHTAGQSLWQTLPLGPIGPGDSPYMGSSAFAGNPLLVAFEPLVERGWIAAEALQTSFNDESISYGVVVPWRLQKLREAFAGYQKAASAADQQAFADWLLQEHSWVGDYTLFMALDQAHSPSLWPEWPAALARRDPTALAAARTEHAAEIGFWGFVQWQFDVQWKQLKAYANQKNVHMVGDLPIFIAHHSSDCWSRPDLYELDASGNPLVIAGVPPDFFSETGQRWGNPLYNWAAMKADGYSWWIERVKRQLSLADVVRIDHFRGFVGYWEIPASEPTAVKGRWMPGPDYDLFAAIEAALGKLPIIAEDLGVITDEVVALRTRAGFPGMRILQFAFSDDASNNFLPHNYERDTVVYSGTHDNDTVKGWWADCTERERAYAGEYLHTDGSDVHWAMIRACAQSVANHAVCQFQDVLGLDGRHRMNTPGTVGCWTWRFKWDWVNGAAAETLAHITAAARRTSFERLPLPAYPEGKNKP
ncbi:4-alpha-glucanotransferase [Rhodoferax sp.]|uniref:4-alpha-glucanotransferase n=1 Tax=Rhodoferax sp. TaxID=50421 RepID=UPI00374CB87B